MKYENLKSATSICAEIDKLFTLLQNIDQEYVEVHLRNAHFGVFEKIELKYEPDEILKQMAAEFRNKVAQYYRNRIESLKTELEKL